MDMSKGKLSVLLIWNGTDFSKVDRGRYPFDDNRDTLMYIHELSRTIVFRMGVGETNITKRIIMRIFNSIAKTGFQYSPGIRLGANFNIVQHEGDLDIKMLVKELDGKVSKKILSTSTRTSPQVKRIRSPTKPSNQEALVLGLKLFQHLSKGYTVIISPGDKEPIIKVFKEEKVA